VKYKVPSPNRSSLAAQLNRSSVMKRFARITAAAFLLSIHAASGADASYEIMQFREEGGGSVSYTLIQGHAAMLPRWDARTGEPPLSQRKAIDIALAEIRRRKLPLETLELHSVSLTRIGEVPISGLWFYGVTFSPIMGGMTKPYWKSMVLVLMDGSVVNPVLTPK
jgi:hypothetical protein